MNLFFAEHEYQAADILQKTGGLDGQWVAAGPSAMHFLMKRGKQFLVPEHFCSDSKIESECRNQYSRLTEACRAMDDRLWEREPLLAADQIRPFFFSLWILSLLCDVLLSRVIQLKSVLSRFEKPTVFFHRGYPLQWGTMRLGFAKSENLWGRLLELPGWNMNRHFWEVPATGSFQPARSRTERIRRVIGSAWTCRNVIDSVRYGLYENIFNYLRNNARKGILLLNGAYQWSYLLSELVADGYSINFVLASKEFETGRVPRLHLKSTEVLWEEFKRTVYSESGIEIDFLQIIRDRFDWLVSESPSWFLRASKKLDRLISKKNIRLLITSEGMDPFSIFVNNHFKKRGIPVLCWQHGAQWFNCNRITQRNDLVYDIGYNLMLVYGDGVRSAYLRSGVDNPDGINNVGSVSLEMLRNITFRPKAKPAILLVTTNFYGNSWYCGFSPPFNDRVYFLEQETIVGWMSEGAGRGRFDATVKIPPNGNGLIDSSLLDRWKKILGERAVLDKPSFSVLLSTHDIIIVDSPTTTLLEAVATRLPVFVLMSHIGWPEDAIALLRKRAFCAGSASMLTKALEEFLITGSYPADVNDNSFLKLYGTHLDDGNTRNRALAVLKRSMERTSAEALISNSQRPSGAATCPPD